MIELPRIAIGTIQSHASIEPIVGAFLGALHQRGLRVQTFLSQARLSPADNLARITSRTVRHLDSWLMSKPICNELFAQCAASTELAVVAGQFTSGQQSPHDSGGNLDTLCSWLDLPRIVVVDASKLDHCRLVSLPSDTSGILLDRVSSDQQGRQLQISFKALFGIPVLGFLPELPELRDLAAERLRQRRVSRQLWAKMGFHLAESLDIASVFRFANRQTSNIHFQSTDECRVRPCKRLNVAIAFDQAFHEYFPNTIHQLVARGATIQTFSPLRDEQLPQDADVVYYGGGPAEQYAEELSGNECMKQSLRNHVRKGGRVYAERSGLAYLSQRILMPGRQSPWMAGVLPIDAAFDDRLNPDRPVELTLVRDNWLGRATSRLRGYLCTRWRFQPTTHVAGAMQQRGTELVGRHHIVGSRLQVDFAAQPEFFRSFFQPIQCSPSCRRAV